METIAKFRDPALGIKEFYDPVAKLEKAPLNEEKPASEAKKIKEVIQKIQSDNRYDLSVFFRSLIMNHQGDIGKGIEIDVVNDTIKKTFSKILNISEINILTDGLDQDNNSMLDVKEIVNALKSSTDGDIEKIKIHFMFTATVLDKKVEATSRLL